MDFPGYVSFTLTNACNLRCQMCGQWSEEGYMRTGHGYRGPALKLDDWIRLADEAAAHGITSILLRGGEPFLVPGIVALLEHIHGRGLYISIDSNGSRLEEFAADLVRLGNIHVTVSVDGPEAIHDAVRGVRGSFKQLARGLARLAELDGVKPWRVSRSICFTISPWSVGGLGEMPAVARRLGVESLSIVPYYYVPAALGETWEREIRETLGGEAFSWRGFHHEESGVDPEVFAAQHRRYCESLQGLQEYPYMPLTAEEYRTWFTDAIAPVGLSGCANVERLIDVQPAGEANFCVDFPDGSLGNVRQATIAEIWNGERARRFRERRRQGPLGACHRCGARYMAVIRN
ncbi:MAG TPA: radical SAM/SPASM domain-containing protein [Opitutaceae bacterium]|nr:radical SAM/SPASM domain-containing protein [Opitutaceae bacterium]